MPTILSCNFEEASRLMADALIANHGFTPAGKTNEYDFPIYANNDGTQLVRFDQPNPATQNPIVHTDFLSFLQSDLFIFASPHASAAGRPALTVHPLGNWSDAAPLGGRPNTLGLSSAVAMETAFASLRRCFAHAADNPKNGKHDLAGFELTLEATHHGPTELRAPALFVEIGIGPADWQRPDAIAAANTAILDACTAVAHKRKPLGKVAIGFGGTHYCSAFNDLHGKDFAFAHIAAKYATAALTDDLLTHAISRVVEPVEAFVVDWKGVNGPTRDLLKNYTNTHNLEFVRA